ncbi:hypothetical protein [Streptomyces sp. bgisy091]|uniref:hypothetical protein n=1 Tax=Streptomyces sp. bgisy091 TaxID=3413778 RepID=UPI003D75864A
MSAGVATPTVPGIEFVELHEGGGTPVAGHGTVLFLQPVGQLPQPVTLALAHRASAT